MGTVDCARHDVKRPLSVGDLRHGERYVVDRRLAPLIDLSDFAISYVNMDFMFFCSLERSQHLDIVVSYDIACQWSVNLWERMSQYPQTMHVDRRTKTFSFLIPKFHLPAHIMPCQTVYSFNYNKHVGRTDGEAPERGWSQINPAATSTREMGPGSRRDTLDDHFGDWNWKKTTLMGEQFLCRWPVDFKLISSPSGLVAPEDKGGRSRGSRAQVPP